MSISLASTTSSQALQIMNFSIKLNQCSPIVLLMVCLVVPCNIAILFGDYTEPNGQYSHNFLYKILRMQPYKDHIISKFLNIDEFYSNLFSLTKHTLRSLTGNIGERTHGSFLQRSLPPTASFPCRRVGQRSKTTPSSVHQLRPGDIDVIAAIGDRITVGTGANALTLFEMFVENRGLSFSIGGYRNFRTHLTLPNILKEFNPQLVGYSWGDAFGKERGAQFNMGENAAISSDMPFMVYKLLRRMSLDRRVNMKMHWKVVTLMIGLNDFCSHICHRKASPYWTNWEIEQNIIKTLRTIRDTMPRTLVNLVTHPSVSLILSLDHLSNLPIPCQIGRMLKCGCLESRLFSKYRGLFVIVERYYREIFHRIARRPEFHIKPDFTVVFQPFGVNATVFVDNRLPDLGIMATDCVHLSQKGHAVMANALWNNMMQPDGKKTIGLKPLFEEFECPTEESPYIKTYFNSQPESEIK